MCWKRIPVWKGSGQIPAEAKPQLLFSSQTTAFYITRKKVQWLCCLCLWQFPSCYNCERKNLPRPWSHECCFAKTYHFLENMYFDWNFRQMVLKKVQYVWWDATSRCWNMLLQNAIRWKHCEMWEPSMPICWISFSSRQMSWTLLTGILQIYRPSLGVEHLVLISWRPWSSLEIKWGTVFGVWQKVKHE